MQYQIPQFIEIEDKVVGPLTFKQFVYVAGGVGLAIVLYLSLPGLIAIPLILVVASIAGALAFYKFNNKPFSEFLEATFKYAFSNRLYIWHKEPKEPTPKETREQSALESLYVPKLSDSKLRDISWSLDVHEDAINPGPGPRPVTFDTPQKRT